MDITLDFGSSIRGSNPLEGATILREMWEMGFPPKADPPNRRTVSTLPAYRRQA